MLQRLLSLFMAVLVAGSLAVIAGSPPPHVARLVSAERAPAPELPSVQPGVPQTSTTTAPISNMRDEMFLSCVKHRESRGLYTVVNPLSSAGGAYQFLPSTWRNTAMHVGRPDLVDVRPESALPADQEFMARALLAWMGPSPWNGPYCVY